MLERQAMERNTNGATSLSENLPRRSCLIADINDFQKNMAESHLAPGATSGDS